MMEADNPSMSRHGPGARLDHWTRLVMTIGFLGLVVIALLTTWDALARWLWLPRLPGYSDLGQVVYACIIATCFPAGLLQDHNITIRFLGRALGRRATAWLEVLGAAATLAFFALLVWQFALLTADLQKNGRVTPTLEMPLAPWWWLATAIMACTVPVQIWVLHERLRRALFAHS